MFNGRTLRKGVGVPVVKTDVGAIVNAILPYARSVEIVMIRSHPFVKAYCGDEQFTRCVISITQRGEQFTICHTNDDSVTCRYLPVATPKPTFVKESEYAKNKFQVFFTKDPNVIDNLSWEELVSEISSIILLYDVPEPTVQKKRKKRHRKRSSNKEDVTISYHPSLEV